MDKIIVDNVFKRFKIGRKNQSALARILSLFSGRELRRKFFALKGVSLNVKKGEVLGIVGRNGSGKSTLLKTMARIYKEDGGNIKYKGNLMILSGLNNGMVRRLSALDNICLVGSILGLGRRDIRKIINPVLEFAGLEEHLNTKLFQFSTGMLSRLAFSLIANCIDYKKPDILLLDEVFVSGNDLEFQKKAFNKINELIRKGVTILMVSHNVRIIKKFCKRVVWMEDGKIKEVGKTKEIMKKYERSI